MKIASLISITFTSLLILTGCNKDQKDYKDNYVNQSNFITEESINTVNTCYEIYSNDYYLNTKQLYEKSTVENKNFYLSYSLNKNEATIIYNNLSEQNIYNIKDFGNNTTKRIMIDNINNVLNILNIDYYSIMERDLCKNDIINIKYHNFYTLSDDGIVYAKNEIITDKHTYLTTNLWMLPGAYLNNELNLKFKNIGLDGIRYSISINNNVSLLFDDYEFINLEKDNKLNYTPKVSQQSQIRNGKTEYQSTIFHHKYGVEVKKLPYNINLIKCFKSEEPVNYNDIMVKINY